MFYFHVENEDRENNLDNANNITSIQQVNDHLPIIFVLHFARQLATSASLTSRPYRCSFHLFFKVLLLQSIYIYEQKIKIVKSSRFIFSTHIHHKKNGASLIYFNLELWALKLINTNYKKKSDPEKLEAEEENI